MTDTKLLSIQEAAKRLGVSIDTLRRWDKRGILSPMRTPGGQRRYTVEQLEQFRSTSLPPHPSHPPTPLSPPKSFSEHIVQRTIHFLNATHITIRIPDALLLPLRGVQRVLRRDTLGSEALLPSIVADRQTFFGSAFSQ